MKKTTLFLIIVLLVFACDMPNDDGDGPSDVNVSQTLMNLPEFEIILPDSLASGDSSASTSQAPLRSVNDLAIITADSLAPVKSQGWYDLQRNIGLDATTEILLDILKAYAEEHEISMGVPFSLGVQQIGNTSMDMGTVLIQGDTDSDFQVFWYINMEIESDIFSPVYLYIDLVEQDGLYEIEMKYFQHQPEIVTTEYTYEETDLTVETYFNESTSESRMGINVMGFEQVKKSYPNDDGSFTVIVKDLGTLFGGMSIGWGDDEKGGIVSQWDSEYVDVEFYNNNGHLLKKGWGHSELNLDWLNNYDDSSYAYVKNIADWGWDDSVDTIYKRYNETSGNNEFSTDLTTWIENADPIYRLYYRAGTNWVPGDCVYYYDSYDSATGIRTYTTGYTIPAATSYFGGSYYIDYEYPLKWLLPLGGEYTGKNLMSIEGETYESSWTDLDGNIETWSYTFYDFFIDVDENGQRDSGTDLDISGINFSDVYIWDSVYSDLTIEKGAFFVTSGNIPAYFNNPSENEIMVQTVDDKLTEIYQSPEYTDFDLDDFEFQNPNVLYPDIFEQLAN